jgi:hypothetical protein
MGQRRKIIGTCHICGRHGPLSFEHVPPRAAFNDRPMVGFSGHVLADHGLAPDPRLGKLQQRGMGSYTLCERCNANTGAWYGNQYVEWCRQGMEILQRSRGKPTLIYLSYLYPLAILKQIITMFLSVNLSGLRTEIPYLEQFVLDRERKYLPPNLRVYAYYTVTDTPRMVPWSAKGDLKTGAVFPLSEISFPPFGYVLAFEPRSPDPRLVDITHFSRYGYWEYAVQNIQLAVLPTHLPLPGDYRTRAEIERGAGRPLPW